MIHIILFHPEIPANTGNILRTAMATNSMVHIIGPIPFDISDKSLKRAGMDYLKEAKYIYYDSYDEFVKQIGDAKIYYVTKYGTNVYSNVDFSDPVDDVYVMFGRESTGIDKEILSKNKEMTLRIPMLSTARSLNLSNSVAIVVYEILRQKKFPSLATFDMIKKYSI
ncbi:MAG: tRNA (cytidine(34)-2'-O)-methyltransferase [Bacilli bacterium]|nr:tRNA (cytidine(34)-2'-O)-methyltransferase [Bacilli bacterium]